MEINLENTSSLGRKLTIKLSNDAVVSEKQKRMEELRKNIRIDGFRQGNVPKTLVEQRYGKQLRKEAVSSLIDKTLTDAIEKEKLNPADRPIIENIDDNKDTGLSFTVTMEIFPEIELQDYEKIEVEKSVAEISDKDIEKNLENLKDQFALWEEKQGKAEKSDKVTIDFEGFIDDKPFDNGSATDYPLELGSGTFIPGFEDGLIGVVSGDEKSLDIKFPKEYGVKDLADKNSVFKVKVKKVESKKKAVIDEDFAKKIGIEDGDTSKVNAKIKENLEKHVNSIIETKLRDNVLEKLLELNPIDIPEVLINKEIQVIKQDLQRRNILDSNEEEVSKDAKKRVSIALLLNAIVKKHDLTPDENRVKEKIAELSRMFGQSDYIEKMYYESPELIQGINNTVLCDQATDILVEKATIKEKKSSFEELTANS